MAHKADAENWGRLLARNRLRIALALAAAGFVTVLAILLSDYARQRGSTLPDPGLLLWIVAASTLGAGLAGFITAALFGRPGRRGWVFAALASLLASALGGAIGGSLVLPGLGTLWGVAFVFVSISDRPEILPVWAGSMVAVHSLARRIR